MRAFQVFVRSSTVINASSSVADWRKLAGLVLVGVTIVACRSEPAPSETTAIPIVEVAASHRIIVGIGADHVGITEPLVEAIPPPGNDDVEVRIEFPLPDQPVMLGIEGALAFLRVHAAEGGIIADRIVSFEGETVPMPAGDHTLVVYYRTCDGSCAVLDPPHTFCTLVATLNPGGRYELAVDIQDRDFATCAFVSSE